MSSALAPVVDTTQAPGAVTSVEKDGSERAGVGRPKKDPEYFTFKVSDAKSHSNRKATDKERKVQFAIPSTDSSSAAHDPKPTRSHDIVDAFSAKSGVAVETTRKPVSKAREVPKKIPTTHPVVELIVSDDDFKSKVVDSCEKIKRGKLTIAALKTGILLHSFGAKEMEIIDLLTCAITEKWIADSTVIDHRLADEDKTLSAVVKFHLLFKEGMRSIVKEIEW